MCMWSFSLKIFYCNILTLSLTRSTSQLLSGMSDSPASQLLRIGVIIKSDDSDSNISSVVPPQWI